MFARVAADITSADANIVHIAMDEDLSQESTVLRFVIQVSDRVHLANVMRRVRTNPDVMRIARERPSEEGHHVTTAACGSIANARITDVALALVLARRRWNVICVPVPASTRGSDNETSDLEGIALDYWVARSLHDFVREIHFTDSGETVSIRGNDRGRPWDGRFTPSTSWEAAAAVLERAQRLEVRERTGGEAHCVADIRRRPRTVEGRGDVVAGRAAAGVRASRFGEAVDDDVPGKRRRLLGARAEPIGEQTAAVASRHAEAGRTDRRYSVGAALSGLVPPPRL